MYINDIKLFAKNERELEALIKIVRIYSQDIGMEFGLERCAMLVMKSGKWYMRGVELPNQSQTINLITSECSKLAWELL